MNIKDDPKPAAYHFRVYKRSVNDNGSRHTADSKRGPRWAVTEQVARPMCWLGGHTTCDQPDKGD